MTDVASARAPPASRSLFQLAMLRMRRNRAAMVSLVVFGLIVLFCVVGPFLAPHNHQQIFQAYGQVSDSFRFLMNSWTTIINLISIYQRLRGFERQIPADSLVVANDYDDPRYLATETVAPAATPVVVPE